jgi:hypothetical protein
MIVITAKVAPVILAKTSKTSALLVVVKNACINSIEIPKINEKINEKAKGLKLLGLFNFFLKYKNQSVVNTK